MAVPALRWLSLALIVLAAFWLRTNDLARRPMHADEANQAFKTGELLENGFYRFDPMDHHGPTLYYAALPVAWLRGERSLSTLSETSVRLVPAIAGTVAVVLLALIAFPLGQWQSLVAAAFLAVSPPSVYYSRYFVQETLLVTFTLGLVWCAQNWWRRGNPGWAIGAGACLGLMQATKASAPLFILAAATALIAARPSSPVSTHRVRAIALALLAAMVVAILFYSSFGTHWTGVRDAIDVYGPAASRATGESGHEKPWWYYLRLFGWHREGGLLWQQIALSSLAMVGAIGALIQRRTFARPVVLYTAIIAIVLSLTPYKTPWHAVHLVPGFALLAAAGVAHFSRAWIAVPITLLALYFQYRQTNLVAFLRPADARNPYAYVHSSSDVLKVRPLADAALSRAPNDVIRIISEEYWPLPWYLRGVKQIGYWATPPDNCDGALVIASAEQADGVRARLNGSYRESLLGLRPGFLFVVFTPEP